MLGITGALRTLLILSLGANVIGIGAGLVLMDRLNGWGYLRAKYYEYVEGSPYTDSRRPFYESSLFKREVSVHGHLPVQPGDVVFLGDSHVGYGPWAEIFGTLRVRNRGIAGDNTTGVLHRLDPIAEAKPAAIFLSIGSNDVDQRYHDLSVEEVVANVRTIVDRIQTASPRTAVYLLSSLPKSRATTLNATETPLSRALNARYAALAPEVGAIYLDVAAPLSAEDGSLQTRYSFDGGHLNGAGYAVVTEVIRPYVERALTGGPSPTVQALQP